MLKEVSDIIHIAGLDNYILRLDTFRHEATIVVNDSKAIEMLENVLIYKKYRFSHNWYSFNIELRECV